VTDTPNVAAAAWLAGLASRGIQVHVQNGRLRMDKRDYQALTDDEVLVLRHHRAEIVALVAAGVTDRPDASGRTGTGDRLTPATDRPDAPRRTGMRPGRVGPDAPSGDAHTAPPAPPLPCAYCCAAPCIGESHPAFEVLHSRDPRLVAQRDGIATREMFEGLRRAAGRPPTVHLPTADEFTGLPPEIAERERAMKAERIRRGWEHPHGVGVRRAF
jgi:hypothetical protein